MTETTFCIGVIAASVAIVVGLLVFVTSEGCSRKRMTCCDPTEPVVLRGAGA